MTCQYAHSHPSRALKAAVMSRCVPQEARGGEVVVREGLLVQPPTITAQPADATVNEGATVQLSVKAVVSVCGDASGGGGSMGVAEITWSIM
jgi:hypothetical protein